ncbi:hypothetical protein GOBAR_DD02314 [Gossypium barbadense]|nr:hypothetical protein GOBAR_DD02314 [Gossypium barbadense]
MVIKDNLGRVFGSQLVLTSHVPMTFAAEALACFHVVRLVLDIGLQEVTIEGDSLTMIRKLVVMWGLFLSEWWHARSSSSGWVFGWGSSGVSLPRLWVREMLARPPGNLQI